MTIGIFGGSFDPIHKGHTQLAQYIVDSGLCDEVLLMVSPLNPLKTGHPPVSFEERLKMARIAVENCKGVRPSDFEKDLPLPSFTYRTLEALRERYPGEKFRLIIGSDNWKIFGSWRNSDDIVKNYDPIIYPRPGYEINGDALPDNITLLRGAPLKDVSSTLLREALSQTDAEKPEMIDRRVWEYAKSRKLYNSLES